MEKQYSTKGKAVLIEYFKSLDGKSFCVKDVLDYLKENNISMNQATVYRNIDKLTEQDILVRHKNPNDSYYYQYLGEANHCHEHLHIQCRKCGRIIHLEDSYMKTFYDYVRNELKVSLEPSESVLIGLCETCR